MNKMQWRPFDKALDKLDSLRFDVQGASHVRNEIDL